MCPLPLKTIELDSLPANAKPRRQHHPSGTPMIRHAGRAAAIYTYRTPQPSCGHGGGYCPDVRGDVCAPLSREIQSALAALIEMRWVDVEAELSEGDWAEYQRLCLAESQDFILDLPDYYAFYTYSMFRGRVVR